MPNIDVFELVLGSATTTDEKWHDIKEELPEFGKKVLCVDEDGDIDFGEYADPDWYSYSHGAITKVFPTHWRELPEAPHQNV